MHELGVVFSVIDTVNEVAIENEAEKVHKVTLEIGEVSTVIPEYLIDVWNWSIKKHELLDECELNVETLEAITFCENCEGTYRTLDFGKTCPHCGSEKTYLLRGNEFNIKEIEIT